MKIIVGIDNGLDGAIVALTPEGKVAFGEVMPTLAGDGTGRRAYNLTEMASILRGLEIDHVYIEKAQPFPKNGSIGNFSTGQAFGIWLGILTALRLPYTVVRPQEWQKAMFVGLPKGNTKQSSAVVASRLAPEHDWRGTSKSRTPHDGKTDAFCIAEWGRIHASRGI